MRASLVVSMDETMSRRGGDEILVTSVASAGATPRDGGPTCTPRATRRSVRTVAALRAGSSDGRRGASERLPSFTSSALMGPTSPSAT